MATAALGTVHHHRPVDGTGQETEGAAPKTVHFQSIVEKDAVTQPTSERPSDRFLPPIEDKKPSKENISRVVCATDLHCVAIN